HNHFEFYPSDAEEIFRQVVETKTAYQTFARPFTFPDHLEWGITYWDWTLTPILDNKGEIDFLVFALNDVTKKKLAEEEAQSHAQLLDLANDAILICDLSGNISYWNKGAEKLYGWSRNEAVGQNILSLLQTEPMLKAKDIRERFFRDGYWEGERVHTKKDGKKVTVHSRWTLQRDHWNKPVAFSEINRDITELKRKEKDLQDTSLYSRRLIEASLDPLATISTKGKIMDVNKAVEDVTGIPRKKLIGSDFSDYFTDPERARKTYEMVFSQGFVKDYPLAIRHASGRTMDVLYNATTFKNDKGEVLGVFAAARDVTELRTAQQALQKSLDELERRVEDRTAKLEEINRELESFSYSVSHDLRAPLRAIDGYARMILKKQGDKFDEDILNKFNVIRSSAHMMGKLIDDLLTFSRLSRKELSMSNLDMHALINDVWKELRIINPDRNMFLTIHSIPPGYGDRSLVKQVYSNLLSNAIKFTKHEDAAHIEAGGYTEGNEEVYYIKDNGVGFDMTYYDKLFGVFQRLHSTDDFEGTGVGLATVQRIIRRHGGRVWAEGEPGRGACFYFTLLRKE
ncbi:MAG TPA: PAS domain S-box protein, partial [Syntrophales bacterium]|nr:PAS domain S-box protein [Syntrophales bacterium]